MEKILLENMRRQEPALRKLLDEINGHWIYEDSVYRFYHQSFKVFGLQTDTKRIIDALTGVAPEGQPFCEKFDEVTRGGLEREFKLEDNQHWIESTGPILAAFFHARYFLEMAIKYALMPKPPQPMPSGWAALLCLYGIR